MSQFILVSQKLTAWPVYPDSQTKDSYLMSQFILVSQKLTAWPMYPESQTNDSYLMSQFILKSQKLTDPDSQTKDSNQAVSFFDFLKWTGT